MNTNERLRNLEQRLSQTKHHDLFMQDKHLLERLSDYRERREKEVIFMAIEGTRPNRAEDEVFKKTLSDVREMILKNLEDIAEDLEHKGDKHYTKHFPDGVE